MENNILEINKLRKVYEEFILDDVSFHLPQGNIMGIIGPNGAGKTTTIKLIMNLIRRDGGDIRVFGLDPYKEEKKVKERIGYVGETQPFYEHRSARWTGRFVSHFYPRWDRALYAFLLERFQIPPKKRIKTFSKGMKVKLSLAIAFAHHPELIVLDEPTSGLDPIIRRDVMDFLKETVREENKTVLFSSHITDDLVRVADLILYIIEGRVVLSKTKDDLLSGWKKIHFTTGSLDEEIASGLINLETHMFGSAGITRDFESIKDHLKEGLEKGDIKVENVGLDDILIILAKEI
jgi:ABC-2 type transport system ATP-binding protein